MLAHNSSGRLLIRFLIDFSILLGVFCVAFIVLPHTVNTVQQGFFCDDESLELPYMRPILSKIHLTILVVGMPAAFILVVEMLRAALASTTPQHVVSEGIYGGVASVHQFAYAGIRIPTFMSECYQTIGAYLFGFALELIGSEFTKRRVGRLRPHFMDICQPQRASGVAACAPLNEVVIVEEYVSQYSCSELAAAGEILQGVHQSFPSVYTASATYAMCFLGVYLEARLRSRWLRLTRSIAQWLCLGLAALVALERFSTHQNHWSDILAGAVWGAFCALFAALCIARLFRLRKHRPLAVEVEPIYAYAPSRISSRLYWHH